MPLTLQDLQTVKREIDELTKDLATQVRTPKWCAEKIIREVNKFRGDNTSLGGFEVIVDERMPAWMMLFTRPRRDMLGFDVIRTVILTDAPGYPTGNSKET